MGLHTGEPQRTAEGYTGLDLHRAARICAAGHGGQVLVSEVTASAVRHRLPDGVQLQDLGLHHLKDLVQPEQLYQLDVRGLAVDFPPLRSLGSRPNNLPTPPTPLFGREHEVEQLVQLLRRDEVRLLTLTGAGGSGKTRLALAVAERVSRDYGDGVLFVDLSPIADRALVASTIARALDVQEGDGGPLIDALRAVLRGRRLLLVLDNFEQVVEAAPLLTDLLSSSSGLTLLVTSRVLLRISGEREYAVQPLAVPVVGDRGQRIPVRTGPPEEYLRYGAVALFVERAQHARSGFRLTDENAAPVADICTRLDGLPLAIELAAARSRILSPQALLARLDHRLALLTGGARDLPARQQTLRNTIGWSYDLLTPAEQSLFRQLAVFVGGCSLEAVEAICNAEDLLGGAVLDGIASLIDESLLRPIDQTHNEPRFTMLETIREFALEQLVASGEADELHRLHAEYFVTVAERAEPQLFGTEQTAWLTRLEVEHDNYRAALAWTLSANLPEQALRIAVSLRRFWLIRGHVVEGRRWLERCLAAGAALPPALHSDGLNAAGDLARVQGDYPAARRHFQEGLAIRRHLGDTAGVVWSLNYLGLVASHQEDYAAARSYFEEGVTLTRPLGDPRQLGFLLHNLGDAAREEGDYGTARALLEECLGLCRAAHDAIGVAMALTGLGEVVTAQGDVETARALLTEGLETAIGAGDKRRIAFVLSDLAVLAATEGRTARALRLAGAGAALEEAMGSAPPPRWAALVRSRLDAARTSIGEETAAAAFAEGRALSLDEAVALALEQTAGA
jgi:predicted ATPase